MTIEYGPNKKGNNSGIELTSPSQEMLDAIQIVMNDNFADSPNFRVGKSVRLFDRVVHLMPQNRVGFLSNFGMLTGRHIKISGIG